MRFFERVSDEPDPRGKAELSVLGGSNSKRRAGWVWLLVEALALALLALAPPAVVRAQGAVLGQGARPVVNAAPQRANLPPQVIQAQRFLAGRGWAQGRTGKRPGGVRAGWRSHASSASAQTPATATWQPLGPAAVQTPNFNLVTGRISALALDPSDTSGKTLFVGTTGGGVWKTQNANAASSSSVTFKSLTDSLGALSGAADASISIGALAVQPGGTGVILAGTGDPNDALDSYYGAGILRSADGGNTWNLIPMTVDAESGLSNQDYSFVGEGFAGFAWSMANPNLPSGPSNPANPNLVVAAVSQAFEGMLVNADRSNVSYEGLYYSTDAGVTWHLATITDGNGADVQGPTDAFANPDGNAATSVVWNPTRQLFVAAVRYHGYYQSPDGVTWTRMTAQPGTGLTTANCPNNLSRTGLIGCPIFRGTLAVNPQTGDTFAWTVNAYNQDQGIWQDQCAINASGSACGNPAITFALQMPWFPGESATEPTIANGDYNLALAAAPSGQETMLLAGDNDLWKCSVTDSASPGCVWRNTTNSTVGFCAQVGEFQHALAWDTFNPLEIFVGNDSGLWRSMDAIGETGPACSASDASHFQNLNGSLGSLAEVESISQTGLTPYTMMAGLGANGTAGVKDGTTPPSGPWPQILAGNGGPVAIDPSNPDNWYVNNEEGVSIYLCSDTAACTPSAFGTTPVVTDADVGGDGYSMGVPAPFLVDPADPTQLLIGTCRVWRGPAGGTGWSGAKASLILDQLASPGPCSGNALIRSLAAMEIAGGGEVVYAGMYGDWGDLGLGGNAPGQVFSVTYNPASGWSNPQNLTLNPVTLPSQSGALNALNLDISSITIDPHDLTGQTVYVTVEGFSNPEDAVPTIYRSTNGGASWVNLTANLPWAPANSVAVDPQSANTVYVATDVGVYFTTGVGSCTNPSPNCWSLFGAGLPKAPVVQLSAAPLTASAPVLTAGTYGRGIWQTPLWSSETGVTTAITSPPSPVIFTTPVAEYSSSALTVSVENTGSLPLIVPLADTAISGDNSGEFSVTTDGCQGTTVQPGGNCMMQVTFAPIGTGTRTAQMTIYANVYGGQLPLIELSGTGSPPEAVTLTPATISFDAVPGQSSLLPPVPVGSTSGTQQVTAGNSSSAAVAITNIAITSPFTIVSNVCGTSSFAPGADCQIMVAFAPTQRGAAAGTLTLTDGVGTQTVALSGFGWDPPTDGLSANSLSFGEIVAGQLSPVQTISLSNTGDLPLTNIAITVSGPFTETDTCDGQLAANWPNSSCAISVQFAPNAGQLGSQTGTLTVTDALRTQTVALSGTALQPPLLTVSPASLNFGAIIPGQSSAAQTVTITNGTSAAASSLTLSPVTAPFSMTQNTCPASLAAGASCTVGIIFQPAAYGSFTGALTANSPSVAEPVAMALSGTGFDFTVTVTGPATQTVSNGQTANFALVITPADGLPGTFTFQHGALPANTQCLFNPSTETVSAGAPGNATVEIFTGQSGSSARSTAPDRWRALPLACGLILLPLAWRRRRKAMLLAALLTILAGSVSSCVSSSEIAGGGSGGQSDGPGSTPAGSYSIPVTVTFTGVQHNVTVTLIVD
jgi:hypothetical protein